MLRLDEVERPVPEAHDVLVRVHATSVTRTDAGLRSAEYVISRLVTGPLRPKHRILGSEFAGDVEAVGSAVTESPSGTMSSASRARVRTRSSPAYRRVPRLHTSRRA